MNRKLYALRDRLRYATGRFARLDVPPFVKLGLLMSLAVLPFAAFVALQDEPEPESVAAPIQQAIDTSQRFPLVFPFGGNPDPVTPIEPEIIEMSPSPSPTPRKSPNAASPKPPTRAAPTNPAPPPPPPPVPPAQTPAAPTPPVPPAQTPPAPPPPPPPPAPKPQCSDGIDNDGDGDIDGDDFSCRKGPHWNNEASGITDIPM